MVVPPYGAGREHRENYVLFSPHLHTKKHREDREHRRVNKLGGCTV